MSTTGKLGPKLYFHCISIFPTLSKSRGNYSYEGVGKFGRSRWSKYELSCMNG